MSQNAEVQAYSSSSAKTGQTNPLDAAIEQASSFLVAAQHPDGYWLAELEADTTLESDYIVFLHVIGRFDPARIAKLARYVRDRQLPDGGWNIYTGGPSEVNAT